jgi:hypothetical protein
MSTATEQPPIAPPAAAVRKAPVIAAPTSFGAPSTPGKSNKSFTTNSGVMRKGWRVGIYAPGGAGKTTLAASLQEIGKRVKFIDLEGGSVDLDVPRVEGVETFQDLLDALRFEPLWEGVDAIVLDTATKAEEMAVEHVLANVKNDSKPPVLVDNIEAFGWGKGYTHVYDAFLELLGALDNHYRRGRSVILIMHECTADVPNPSGEDYIRYEPRLQSPKSGKASIRHKVKEWLDHLLFIGYDINEKNGKAIGTGTRTIYGTEKPMHWAKSRTSLQDMQYKKDSTDLWEKLYNTPKGGK